MKMTTPPGQISQFTIGLVNVTDKGGDIVMGWDRTGAVVPFTVSQ